MPSWKVSLLLVLVAALTARCQQNRAPHFATGGDMARLSLPEDTPVGAAVYTLRGIDPEGGRLHYSISGQFFTVNRDSGVVTLVRALDRERQDLLEVIISITDEAAAGLEPNTVSLRREIPVLDRNDNAPQFEGRPYSFTVAETARAGSVVYEGVTVSDADGGVNGEVTVQCDAKLSTPEDACDTFTVSTVHQANFPSSGARHYTVQVSLLRALDYERRSAYSLVLRASDNALEPASRLTASANVAVHVQDVQDQPPVFLNAPFSATVPEASPQGTSVLRVRARDGDTGEPRNVVLRLEGDEEGHFSLENIEGEGSEVTATLVTSNVPLDREDPRVLQSGGIYTFSIVATEIAGAGLEGESAKAQVMIVVTDVDDQLPTFNQMNFSVNVSEDIGKDTPLPGLNLVVHDRDVGENSHYWLQLRDSSTNDQVNSVFSVQPDSGIGRTPVLVRVKNPQALDFDNPINEKPQFNFKIVAVVRRDGKEIDAAQADIVVNVLDSNDHIPVFPQSSYKIRVSEDSSPGTLLKAIQAKDLDSGNFGRIKYSLQGFGVERFSTDSVKGGLYLAKICPPAGCVDYEAQRSYSLTLSARDGGSRIATASLVIEVDDVNDNMPQFDQLEYRRTIREGATSFDPQLFVRATDVDGPSQGDGKITYSIVSSNAPEGRFFLDPESGELRLNSPAVAGDTPVGQYELKIRASDHGSPTAQHSEANIVIRVGVPGNQQPVFRGGPTFEAKIAENAAPGDNVFKFTATDPDGRDTEVVYRIVAGAKDIFVVNESSGQISVAPGGIHIAEREDDYKVLVAAIDAGKPYRATATATLEVHIVDINNQAPKFSRDSYEWHVSERVAPGEAILMVSAEDADKDAKLKYSIIEPITAKDKAGVAIKSSYNYKNAFKINETNGEVTVAQHLDHQATAVITFTVQARDLNAIENVEQQVAIAEVTVYIEAYSDDNPVFSSPWTPSNPIIPVILGEQRNAGTELVILSAKDPLRDLSAVSQFELLTNEDGYVKLDRNTGRLQLSQELHYNGYSNKTISVQVRAIAAGVNGGKERMSEATVVIHVKDINHYSPQFSQTVYKSRVAESARHPASVLTVKATDKDGPGPSGYGDIRYSLSGTAAQLFTVDPMSGLIRVAPDAVLDRETQSVLSFTVVASDTPEGGSEQKRSTAMVTVDILDVNDNAPKFERPSYTAVVPENVISGWGVVKVSAKDPDEADSGAIEYELTEEGQAIGLFTIDSKSGEVKTQRLLTGKGRQLPYRLMVRAQDLGQPPLSTDIPLDIYIGDVATNDGVPIFLRPSVNETAHVAENSTLGSPVFQVVASDPDDPNTPNGRLTYMFLENGKIGTENLAFSIDPESGLISTRLPLDRERQEEYTLIVVVQDQGLPPQQASSVLRVEVSDVDDHKPMFRRTQQDDALPMKVREETPVGTEVGTVTAVDEDMGDNGLIDYLITYGNEDGLFNITRTSDNRGLLRVAKQVDREAGAEHLLTIKCFPAQSRPPSLRKTFNSQDPSEIQVRVTVEDIDDNVPIFKQNNLTVGVRLNVPVDTALATMEATDVDADAPPIKYSLLGAEFQRLGMGLGASDNTPVFSLNEKTGELRTASSLAPFADGVFTLVVAANNSQDEGHASNTTVKVFVLRDSELLRFVFAKPPAEVRRALPQFQQDVQTALAVPATLNVYDTQFFSMKDGSLDFSTTTSCFQLVGDSAYDLNDMQKMLDTVDNPALAHVLQQYNVQNIERCSPLSESVKASAVQVWVLIIAALVGAAGVVASVVVCCLHRRYKRQMARLYMRSGGGPGTVSSGGGSGGGYAFIVPPPGSVIMTAPPSVAGHPGGMQEWPPELMGTPPGLLPPGVVHSPAPLMDTASYRSFPR